MFPNIVLKVPNNDSNMFPNIELKVPNFAVAGGLAGGDLGGSGGRTHSGPTGTMPSCGSSSHADASKAAQPEKEAW